ncbi:unnamed protein product [Schistocephalus solidus]|uniref:Uncharacterized protein n=1 Tax=Schistocephalus solidus TaxID=70667 RepID=A0A183SN82_SCHSO|nr:unnamed protein product [Schistocephalus solidus]
MSGHIAVRSRLFEVQVQRKRDNSLLEGRMRKLEKERRERLAVMERSSGQVEATLPEIRRLSSAAEKLSEQLNEKMRIRRQSVGLPKQRLVRVQKQVTTFGGQMRGRTAVSDSRTSPETKTSGREDPLQAKVRAYLAGMKQMLTEMPSANVDEDEGLQRTAFRRCDEFWAPRTLSRLDWNRQLRIYHDRGDTLYSPPPERAGKEA